jgi:signal transduction histidine kinase
MDSADFQLLRLALHELRTPLTSIQLNAQLIERSLEKLGLEKECGLAGTIVSAARKMDGLTRELGDIARLMSGSVALDLAVHDLSPLLPDILARHRGAADGHGIRVVAPAGPLPIVADLRCLDRILSNLVSLGLRLDSDGTGIDLRVSTSETEIEFSIITPANTSEVTLAVPSDDKLGLRFLLARVLVECHGGKLEAQRGAVGEIALRFSLPRRAGSRSGAPPL